MSSKVAVLGLDGLPYSFLREDFAGSELKNLQALFKQGTFKRIDSVLPTVSSVAWATFATGVGPGEHGIYGFVELNKTTSDLTIPLSGDVRAKTVWQKLSELGKRAIVINVPLTYPPPEINGVLISGFLAPTLEQAVWPVSILPQLQRLNYKIDSDAAKMRQGHENDFRLDLEQTLKARFEAAFYLLKNESWDYFQLHVMGTDRINHFFWSDRDQDNSRGLFFRDYYRLLDKYVGRFMENLKDGAELICLSDHGFCSAKKEVQLNRLLEQHVPSAAYSLIPGRIYLNDRSRLDQIKELLMSLRDPDGGAAVIKAVYSKADLYHGQALDQAPDLIARPNKGYDLKAAPEAAEVFLGPAVDGMHTFDDAFFYTRLPAGGRVTNLADIHDIIIRVLGGH